MFIGREKELNQITEVIKEKKGKAKGILVWGVRRCGKSTLIKEAMKSFDGTFINMECAEVGAEKNIEMFASISAEATGMEYLNYIKDFTQLLKLLDQTGRETVVLLDEYQFLKAGYSQGNFDSFIQIALDTLSDNITIILCGSYISVMKGLAAYSAPLYGRFSLSIELQPLNYYEASSFYPSLEPRDKVAFWAVFGGLPFVLEKLVPEKGLEWNIKTLLLDKSSSVYIILTETLLKEIFKIEKAEEILRFLGNGKKRNRDIASSLNLSSSAVADECKRLYEMSVITREVPINTKGDRKKTFYSIKDNLIRFFYGFILPEVYFINSFGADFVWEKIKDGVSTFISRKFEDATRDFISLCIRNNPTIDFYDIGTYWFDSKDENIEYDVVIKQSNGYFIISCKYLSSPLKDKSREEEKEKMKKANIPLSGFGFASVLGYESPDDILLITGEDLYSESEIKRGSKLEKYLGKRK